VTSFNGLCDSTGPKYWTECRCTLKYTNKKSETMNTLKYTNKERETMKTIKYTNKKRETMNSKIHQKRT